MRTFRITKREVPRELLNNPHVFKVKIEQRYGILFGLFHYWASPSFAPPHLFCNDAEALQFIRTKFPKARVYNECNNKNGQAMKNSYDSKIKVSELIESLKKYNPDAYIIGVFDGVEHELKEICFGGGDGCTINDCESVDLCFTGNTPEQSD